MSEDTPAGDHAHRDPLHRLTSGGWLKGLARLAVGAALVTAVLYWSGEEVLERVLDPALIPAVLGGATVHALQRVARLRKWAAMIEGAGLVPISFRHLVRIQFIGMAANQVLPVSEALKIWAVSRSRADVIVATDSLVRDTALHSAMIGAFGLVGFSLASSVRSPWVVAAAAAMVLVPLAIIAALGRLRRASARPIATWRPDILAWTAVETVCQLAVYAIGARAIGVAVSTSELLALAPLLYVSDLMMLTPSGLGLREALFGLVFGALSSDPTGAGVAAGLTISAMVLLASLAGGGVALLVPSSTTALPSSRGSEEPPGSAR